MKIFGQGEWHAHSNFQIQNKITHFFNLAMQARQYLVPTWGF